MVGVADLIEHRYYGPLRRTVSRVATVVTVLALLVMTYALLVASRKLAGTPGKTTWEEVVGGMLVLAVVAGAVAAKAFVPTQFRLTAAEVAERDAPSGRAADDGS